MSNDVAGPGAGWTIASSHATGGCCGAPDTASAERAVRDADAYCKALLRLLDRLGCGGVVLDGTGRITAMNSAVLLVLDGQQSVGAEVVDDTAVVARTKQLTALIAESRRSGETSWCLIERDTGRPAILLPLIANERAGRTILVVVDLERPLRPQPAVLQRLFGLTAAETKLAISLTCGHSPTEVADEMEISRSTVRSQLASIFSKTHTCRQAELVSLLARTSMLW